jgi:putative methyltransferase (TIGR04325 family)
MGDYRSWAEATSKSGSYNGEEILQRVLRATLEVESGQAVFERDGCTFSTVAYSWPLLSSLLWVYGREHRLAVVDIGGSLGSTWRQNRRFLGSLKPLEWMIVEQPEFVRVGREMFQQAPLTFHTNVGECLDSQPNLALLGSSLQYLEDPLKLLDELARSSIDYLVLDRTPTYSGKRNRLTVQVVAPHIYHGSYPCWIFGREELEGKLSQFWDLVETWTNADEAYAGFELRGYLFRNLRRKSLTEKMDQGS